MQLHGAPFRFVFSGSDRPIVEGKQSWCCQRNNPTRLALVDHMVVVSLSLHSPSYILTESLCCRPYGMEVYIIVTRCTLCPLPSIKAVLNSEPC